MRTLLLALLLVTGGALVTPVASACPDPDHPCTPQPIDPFPDMPCEQYGGTWGFVKHVLSCLL